MELGGHEPPTSWVRLRKQVRQFALTAQALAELTRLEDRVTGKRSVIAASGITGLPRNFLLVLLMSVSFGS